MTGAPEDSPGTSEFPFEADLAAAQRGDQDAFARLWRSTHPLLIRYLRVTAGDQTEDIASEAWLKAIRALGSFQGDEQGFRGWMVTIARNQLRETHRRSARRPETLTAEPDPPQGGSGPDVADIVLESLDTEQALRLVATLRPDQAEMVMLRVVIGLDVADVARIVGRSPGAVRVAVHRALRRLADQLQGRPGALSTLPRARRAVPHGD
jgi:RNA polymerase sigma-70 factor (ECF subfamily)